MGYEMLERTLAEFDGIVAALRMTLADDSPIKNDFDTTRDFLHDKRTQEESVWMKKWQLRFEEFYHTQNRGQATGGCRGYA
jgi:hypothetical protein